jgi:hypothetical protein
MPKADRSAGKEAVLIEEMLSLLQEKRTGLKTIRAGIAVLLAQLSLAGFLAARARSRLAALPVIHGILLLSALNLILFAVALFLVVRPFIRIRRVDAALHHHRESLCALGRCEI